METTDMLANSSTAARRAAQYFRRHRVPLPQLDHRCRVMSVTPSFLAIQGSRFMLPVYYGPLPELSWYCTQPTPTRGVVASAEPGGAR